MACLKHESDDLLPSVPAGTEVLLDRRPVNESSPAVAFLWVDSGGRCDTHAEPIDDADHGRLPSGLAFTHVGTLTVAIPGFRCRGICRQNANGTREILYRFRATGDQLQDIRERNAPICP